MFTMKNSRIIKYLIIILFVAACKNKGEDKSSSPDVKSQVIAKIANKAKNHILVCAHRSYHKNAPENSLQSITNAIDANIDFVEIDVRTTKDKLLVLMHDDTINRVTTGKGLVKDYTYAELQAFDLKIGDSVTNQKIPLLEDALKLAKGKVIPNLDLKAVDYKQLYNMLVKHNMQHEVISFIGKKQKVMEMLEIDSLYAVLPISKTMDDMEFYYKNTKSSLQHFNDDTYTKAYMDWIHERDELVFINSLWDEDEEFGVGNTASMDSVIALKPAIIQTDHPKLLVDYLRSKQLHD